MMHGFVNSALEAKLTVEVRDSSGIWQPLDAMVDTAFAGELVLPASVVSRYGLPFLALDRVLLGNGSLVYFNAYSAVVLWHGSPRTIRVLAGPRRLSAWLC